MRAARALRVPTRALLCVVVGIVSLSAAVVAVDDGGGRRHERAGRWQPLVIRYSGPNRTLATEHRNVDRHLEVTSGSLLVRDGDATPGAPDAAAPDPEAGTTHSAVFRARTRRTDFADAKVSLRLRNDGLREVDGREPHDYDGVSLGVRYHSPGELYYVNLQRRDGAVTIKKKVPSNGGAYETLAVGARPVPYGRWVMVDVTVQDVGEGVKLAVRFDGEAVLSALDEGGRERSALTAPGRVLLRGDNCQFAFNDLTVTPLGATSRRPSGSGSQPFQALLAGRQAAP